jgi:hypothetical protein
VQRARLRCCGRYSSFRFSRRHKAA